MVTEGISQEALDCVEALDDALGFLSEVDRPILAHAMQSLINSTIERCAAVAETVVVGKPAYTHDDHRKPKSPSMTRIAIGQAIRQMKGSTNV